MNAKNLILGLSVAAIGLSSCCNTSTKTNVSLKNEADTASFYIGYMYGSNITGNGIEDINMDAIIAGMNSAKLPKADFNTKLKKKEPELSRQIPVLLEFTTKEL